MPAIILDGKAYSKELETELTARLAALKRIEAEHQFPLFEDRCLEVVQDAVEESSSLSAIAGESGT